ncbi:MAG: peptide chain release factor 1 [Elusimicrobiota bacterium]
MNPKYEAAEKKYRELQARLSSGELSVGSEPYQQAAREFKRAEPLYLKIQAHKKLLQDKAGLESLKAGDDGEMRELARQELDALSVRQAAVEKELEELLLPRDPRDERNVIVEIRAGAGGDEAAIFAGDLFRMYTRYAAARGFAVEPYSSHPTGLGGFKEVVFSVRGRDAFRHFKFERGVHRVQRVPATEASGRVHTSTATVAVMPEVEEVEVDINPADLRIDTYRSSGAGGQHVNKTESAIRITHIPTGFVVACQEERSQIKNRAKAMSLLRSNLYQMKLEKAQAERRDLRRAQVGTGDRSEKIRTYNFPQDRVTDHRVNENFHNLPGILEGAMDDIVRSLWEFERAQRLAEESV